MILLFSHVVAFIFICNLCEALTGSRKDVLVLDLDGTLYEDDCLIETQIRDNCWIWGKERFGIDPETCQAMHEKWGSTIRGVCEELGAPVTETVTQYYNEVYPNMNFGKLRKYSDGNVGTIDSSGYSHGLQSGDVLRSLHKFDCPIVLASNSPIFHVKRALTRLGLANLKISAFMTPERIGGILKTDPRFWEPLFDLYPQDKYRCSLIDDNGLNIKLVSEQLGMRGFRITPSCSLAENLLRFLGVNAERDRAAASGASEEPFGLDAASYLHAKNEVDNASLNEDVLKMLSTAVSKRVEELQSQSARPPLRVVDLGAGVLNMLSKVVEMVEGGLGGGSRGLVLDYLAFENNPDLAESTKQRLLNEGYAAHGEVRAGVTLYKYSAPKTGLVVNAYVASMDFMTTPAIALAHDIFAHEEGGQSNCNEDDSEEEDTGRAVGAAIMPASPSIDLFIGCCVADLIAPHALAAQLLELAGDKGGLLYLPITFAGRTELLRRNTGEAEEDAGSGNTESSRSRRLPSDEVVMSAYHAHLEKCGHYLCPNTLMDALRDHGCHSLLPPDAPLPPSPWRISRRAHPYLFRSMEHFLALGTVFQLLKDWDIEGWFSALNAEAKAGKGDDVTIVAHNVDLLLRLPEIPQNIVLPGLSLSTGDTRVHFGDVTPETASSLRESPTLHPGLARDLAAAHKTTVTAPKAVPTTTSAVEFLGNKKVRVIDEPLPSLKEGQVLIQTCCSSISTGTELKIFRGDVDPDQPTDLTIAGMQEESMRYPMRYGYSLVGEVVACGEGVDPAEWMGSLVFSFSPHASAVVAPVSGLMRVPSGISAEDASLLPSMETAVSLAMAARPVLGERVAVVGQGLIGQLTSAVLAHMNMDVTLVDVNPSRLNAAAAFVPNAAVLDPSSQANRDREGDFDVVVEISGAAGGLQGAVDLVGKYGRVVLGSLYGEKDLPLKLGLDFHRSGVQLQASQVSAIPPHLRGRWTKRRRFELSWQYVRKLQPSRILKKSGRVGREGELERTFLESSSVADTFRRLDKGEIISSLVQPKQHRVFHKDSGDDLAF